MNRLSTEQRAQVVGCLVEGMSIRATVRVTGVAKNTIVKLIADLGAECDAYQDLTIRDLPTTRVECDEIWSFCYAKQKNVPEEFVGTPGYGDVWCWVAIDADTKLIASYLVGERTQADCWEFLHDLKTRLRGRIQLSTDGLQMYANVVEDLWGAGIDYAMVIKEYGGGSDERRDSPADCTGVKKQRRAGRPDMKKANTSYVERQNLTMRMGMRRYTRLTNGFSKKIENHAHATSIHFAHYNFCRVHKTLSAQAGRPTTPAMAAGLARYPWSVAQLVELAGSN